MRVKFNTPQALGTYNVATTAFINYVTETSGDPNSRYSFLYAPAFNNNNRLAAQANINTEAATYKEVRVWNADGTSILVAAGDSNIGPVFFAMDNSISMNNLDQVAFTTRTSTAASTRRIVVADGTTTTMFPTVSDGAGFTSIDFFAPSINDVGTGGFPRERQSGDSSRFGLRHRRRHLSTDRRSQRYPADRCRPAGGRISHGWGKPQQSWARWRLECNSRVAGTPSTSPTREERPRQRLRLLRQPHLPPTPTATPSAKPDSYSDRHSYSYGNANCYAHSNADARLPRQHLAPRQQQLRVRRPRRRRLTSRLGCGFKPVIMSASAGSSSREPLRSTCFSGPLDLRSRAFPVPWPIR